MIARLVAAPRSLICLASIAAAGCGLLDYSLPIAPGFSVERMNSFMVCLAGAEDLLLVCPSGEVGPIAEYALTEDSIGLKSFGVRSDGASVVDPQNQFFFLVRRSDQRVTGPLTREEWEAAGLPGLSSLHWLAPRNPVFTLLAGGAGWPAAIPWSFAAIGSWWVYRRAHPRRVKSTRLDSV